MNNSRLALFVLRLFLPRRDAEMILGDLIEEHALHSKTGWLWSQVIRSAVPLLWANIRRGGWLKTLGAALAGYFAIMVLVLSGDVLMARFLPSDQTIYSVVSLGIGIPVMVLGGYLASLMRRGAPVVLAIVTGLMGTVSLIGTGDQAPYWYQIALVVIGPAGAIAGGRFHRKRRIRI